MRRRWALPVAALAMIAAGCGTNAGTAAGTARVASGPAGTITESGSGLLYPLAHAWAAAYHQQFPGVTVTTASTGSGTGIALATVGKIDIGTSDAYLASGDLSKNPALLNIPLTISAQTVIYNLPELSQRTHVRLNGAVLAGMYAGTITMWNDQAIARINPGLHLPAIKVVPVHRSNRSGDTFLFTSYLSTQDRHWNDTIGYGTTAAWPPVGGAKSADGSIAMVSVCRSAPGCVAYNGISYLSQAQAGKLGEAALANAAGRFTLPTAKATGDSVATFASITPPNETISLIDGPSADGYPIVNYEYAIVSTKQRDAGKASGIRAFLDWVITTGNSASYLDPVGFAPLPPSVVSLSQQQIAEIGT